MAFFVEYVRRAGRGDFPRLRANRLPVSAIIYEHPGPQKQSWNLRTKRHNLRTPGLFGRREKSTLFWGSGGRSVRKLWRTPVDDFAENCSLPTRIPESRWRKKLFFSALVGRALVGVRANSAHFPQTRLSLQSNNAIRHWFHANPKRKKERGEMGRKD